MTDNARADFGPSASRAALYSLEAEEAVLGCVLINPEAYFEIAHLINTVPTSLHAEAYGRIVQRNALRRRLLEAASAIAKLAYEEERDINEVVNDAEAAIFAVGEQRLTKDLTPINEAISTYYDRVQFLIEHRGEQFGVPTGFYDLDKVLGGMQKSDLLIIAGRPGSGKTGFMISAAKNAAQIHKKHVAIFSLEMSNEQLIQRLIAQEDR